MLNEDEGVQRAGGVAGQPHGGRHVVEGGRFRECVHVSGLFLAHIHTRSATSTVVYCTRSMML